MSLSFHDFDQLYSSLCTPAPVVVKEKKNYCQECDLHMEMTDDGYVCVNCGQCSGTALVADKSYQLKATVYSRKSIYKRRLYCREKLKLLCGRKKCFHVDYKKTVLLLKKKKVKNIVQLKQYLQDWNKRIYYKHVYTMFFDVTGKKLITISSLDIQRLSSQFVNIEIKFKRSTKRKNIYNYNSILYHLMKKNKMKGYKHIILPLNHVQISRQIKKFIRG